MKKFFVLILMLSMIAAAFMGCTQKPTFGSSSADTNGNLLRDDVELKIMKAYYKENNMLNEDYEFSVKDFEIQYFGTYNGADAVIIWHKKLVYSLESWNKEIVGEFSFTYYKDNPIRVWHSGRLYRLNEVYSSKILSDTDIENIYNKLGLSAP